MVLTFFKRGVKLSFYFSLTQIRIFKFQISLETIPLSRFVKTQAAGLFTTVPSRRLWRYNGGPL